ncbi:MAG: hypothetical protein O2960_13535 [Verrucomicrobia bacterium]|nr:hypothetical protein [Verrucomicrobiota bacterium]
MNSTLEDLAPLMRELLHHRHADTSLEALGVRIRQTVPEPNDVSELKLNHGAELVTFAWKGRHFLVRKSLEVFELKNRRIFITGSSQLMQSVLKNQNKIQKIVPIATDMLLKSEALLRHSKPHSALEVLQPLKRTLTHLLRAGSNEPKPREPADGVDTGCKRAGIQLNGSATLPWRTPAKPLAAAGSRKGAEFLRASPAPL